MNNIITSKANILANIILTTLLSSIVLPAYASSGWGTAPLSDKYRPSTRWTNNFSITPNIIANGSISDAIDSCDVVVGPNKYCVIEVSNTASGLPLEIFRSKTKLIGTTNMNPLGSDQNGTFINIGNNTQQVIVEGLNLEGHSVGNSEIYGIVIEGKNIKNIHIKNNKIHGFDSNENAHGIAVFGTGKNNKEGIYNIVIDGNEIYEMRTGSSESVVVNGNVRRWEIKNNDIYGINNIAIDAIGGEGTSPLRTDSRGRKLPGKFDAARYGYIEDNYVADMSTATNPAYDNQESWAAAIYVDGGHHIQIKNNVVENTPWAYEVGAENCLVSRHITLTGNSAEDSYYGDLLLGGYAERGYQTHRNINCNPNNTADVNEGHGYVKYVTVKENLFNTINTSNPDFTLVNIQFRTTNSIVAEPTVEAVNQNGNGSASGDNNAIKITE